MGNARIRAILPIDQQRSGAWTVAKRPGITDAMGVLFQGQYVGWVIITAGGWHWQTNDLRSRTSTAAYPTWERAVSQLARTAWARGIAGDARPGEWRAVVRKPWLPKVPQS